jgi:predicted amidohydrolase YtcJ
MRIAALLGLGLLVGSGAAWGQERIDLLLRNGKVFTADPLVSMQSAIAIRDGRIVAVGGEEIAGRYRADRVLDLHGRLTMPGFIDTHIHIAGDPRWHVDLSHFESIDDIKTALREKAREVGPGKWITGDGWAEGLVRERRSLYRADLDAAAPDNPVVLARAGGHSVVANGLALKLAGVSRSTQNPEGGVIERDERGEPNGIIRERMDIIGRLVPVAPPEDLRSSFVAKLKNLLSLGITSIIVAGVIPQDYAEWETVCRAHRGELPRVTTQIYPGLRKGGASATEAIHTLEAFGKKTADGDEWLRVGAVKLWLDGGFAGPAAWTLQAYRNQPTYFGIQIVDSADLYTLARYAHRAGWQMGFHAIGDAAIKLGADVLARVIEETPRANHRHYLNHFTVMPPAATMRKMVMANIHVSQQPNFTWAPTLESRYVDNLEGERLERNNPIRTPMSQGIFMAFGSDNHPIGPMPGLYGAVTRRGSSGHVYAADERISMPEALIAYTRNGAYFTFEETQKGTIEPGKAADVIVLSDNLLEIEPAKILDTKVDVTILNGKIVYQRPGVPLDISPPNTGRPAPSAL